MANKVLKDISIDILYGMNEIKHETFKNSAITLDAIHHGWVIY